MRKYIIPIIAVAALGLAEPALAYDSGNLMSMQAALGVATDLGLATVSHTQFAGDEWQIEGRDISGRWMEVDVDAATGEVLNVDRQLRQARRQSETAVSRSSSQPHAARPSSALRCFNRGITSCFNSVSEWCQASGLCL